MANVIARAYVEVLPKVSQFSKQLTRDLRKVTSTFKNITVGVSVGSVRKAFVEFTKLNVAVRAAIAGFVILGGQVVAGGLISAAQAAVQLSGALLLIPAAAATAGAVMATLKVGLFGVDKVFKDFLKGDVAKFNEDLAKLSPNAQQALGVLKEFTPQLTAFKNAVQDALFKNLRSEFESLGKQVLPRLQLGFVGIATELNSATRGLIDFVLKSSSLRDVDVTFQNIQRTVHNLVPVGQSLAAIFLDLITVGSGFLPSIASQLTVAVERLRVFVDQTRASGQLSEFIARGIEAVKQVVSIVVDVFRSLVGIFRAADSAGLNFFDTLQRLTGSLSKFINSAEGQKALSQFFANVKSAGEALFPVLKAIFTVFNNDLAPILVRFAQILSLPLASFINFIGQALNAAQPGLEAFAKGVGDFFVAIEPAIPAIGQLFGAIAEFIGKILSGLGPAFNDFLKQLADALTKVFTDQQLVDDLIDLGKAFIDLGVALIPLIPPLVDLAKAIIPALTNIVKILLPVVQPLVDAFIALLPAIEGLLPIITALLIPLAGLAILLARLIELLGKFFNAFGKGVVAAKNWGTVIVDVVTTGRINTEKFQTTIEGTAVAADLAGDKIGTSFLDMKDVIRGAFDSATEKARKAAEDLNGAVGSVVVPISAAGQAAGLGFEQNLGGRLGSSAEETIGWMESIKFTVFGIIDPLGRAGSGAGFAFADGLRSQLGIAVDNARGIVQDVSDALSGHDFSAAGASVTRSFAAGMVGSAALAAVRAASAAVAGAAGSALPHSPAEVGPFSGQGWTPFRGLKLAEGFAEGIQKGQQVVRDASLQLAGSTLKGLRPTLSPTLLRGSVAQSPQSVTVAPPQVTVNPEVRVFIDGKEMRVIATEVVNQRDRQLKRAATSGVGGAR